MSIYNIINYMCVNWQCQGHSTVGVCMWKLSRENLNKGRLALKLLSNAVSAISHSTFVWLMNVKILF